MVEAFTPDFYLPEQDLYVEVTVMKQSLVTRKNRKLRKLRERYPDVKVKLFYRRDIERLAQRYRLRARLVERRAPHAIGEVYLTARGDRGARRGARRRDRRATTTGREPLLVAPLKASVVFLADLSRALPIPHALDFVELAGYTRRPATAASGCSRTSTADRRAATCCSSRTSSTPG